MNLKKPNRTLFYESLREMNLKSRTAHFFMKAKLKNRTAHFFMKAKAFIKCAIRFLCSQSYNVFTSRRKAELYAYLETPLLLGDRMFTDSVAFAYKSHDHLFERTPHHYIYYGTSCLSKDCTIVLTSVFTRCGYQITVLFPNLVCPTRIG